MDWISATRIGVMGLAVHKVRAGLSMLGIIFGVASVVAVIAVSEGARGQVLRQLAALGANNIIVKGLDWRGPDRDKKRAARLRSGGLTAREAEAAAACSLISGAAPLRFTDAGVRCGDRPLNASVAGTTEAFLAVMDFQLREGRWLNLDDALQCRRVCVIEDALRDEVAPLESAVGQIWVIDHEPYRVVGVLKSKEVTEDKFSAVDIRQLNRRVYIPLAAALSRTTQNPLADEVNQVIFRCRTPEDIRPAAAYLNRFYEAAHHMEGVEEPQRDFTVTVALDLLKKIEESQQIFNIVMLCSAGISLIVGGIGIMNIMLANVTERRHEVGLRRAVGATQLDILRQFLMESLLICLVGGLAGCLTGIAFTFLVQRLTGWEVALAWWGMAAAVGVALFDGVCFGTYPAWKAAKLDPIECLQAE